MHPEDFLTLDEWHKLLEATATPREATMLWLLGGSGLRVSEAAQLRLDQIDCNSGYIYIVSSKLGKDRTVVAPEPLIRSIQAYLKSRQDNSPYLFSGSDNGHISKRSIQRILDNIASRAGLQVVKPGKVRMRRRISPHLLRHSFSRWTLQAGIDISYLQQQLGHSNLQTTAIYLQALPNHRKTAYEQAGFGKMLEGGEKP